MSLDLPVCKTISITTATSTSQSCSTAKPPEEDNCTTLGLALGAVIAILTVVLVGVVTGWIVYCYSRHKKKQLLLE